MESKHKRTYDVIIKLIAMLIFYEENCYITATSVHINFRPP